MLWLLLLTAGVIKWAQLSPGGDKALAGLQLAMSSGVGFALGCAVVWSGVCLLRQCLLRRAAKRRAQRSSFGSSTGTGVGSGHSAASDAAAILAHSRLGSAAVLAAADMGVDQFDELPLRLLSKRGSLLNLAAAAPERELSFRPQSAGPGLGLGPAAPPPPLVGLQRDSTAATGIYFSASSSFKRDSTAATGTYLSASSSFKWGSTISLRGGGTSTDAGEIRVGRQSWYNAPAGQPSAGDGTAGPVAVDSQPADGSAAGSEGAPLLTALPSSEPLLWR